MRDNTPKPGVLRRMARRLRMALTYIGTGLMYMGASTWPSPEILAALRAKAAKPAGGEVPAEPPQEPVPPPHPERVTSFEDLPDVERRLFLDLEEQFKQENEK